MIQPGKHLQPITICVSWLILSVSLLAMSVQGFTFSAVSVSITNHQVGASATYSVDMLRQYDDLLNQTPWSSSPVDPSATATIAFPPQFTNSLIATATCLDVSISGVSISGFTCTVSNLTITISNAFTSTSLVADLAVIITGITNPGVAYTTAPFIGTIGNDTSSSSTAAEVTFTPGLLNSLSISFLSSLVNTTSDLIITLAPSNQIPQNGGVKVLFPATLTWARDISPTHTFPLNGALACYGITANVLNSSITCNGLFATQTITISSPFSQVVQAGDSVSFGIKGLFSPPTTEPIDQLTVTTLDSSGNSIDSQVGSISGLIPQNLSGYVMSSSLTGPMYVNSLGGLSFSFSLPDTLSFADSFVVSFPAGTSIIYFTTASSIPLQSSTYHSSNNSLVMVQKSANPAYPQGTSVTITFIRYRAPPSVKPTDPITFTVFTNSYSKMIGSSSISAVAKNYTLQVSVNSNVVNQYTAFHFAFTLSDPLSSSGFIDVVLDPQLSSSALQIATIQTNLTISVNGSNIQSAPSTQIASTTVNGSQTYVLRISNLNNTASSITTQSLTVTVLNLLNCPSVCTFTSFSLSTYYSNQSDLVASANYSGSLPLQPGSISLLSVTSTATTTYTFGTLSISFTNQNLVPQDGVFVFSLPSDLKLLTVCVGSLQISNSLQTTTASYNISGNSVSLQLGSGIAAGANLSFILTNLLTQNSTQTTGSFTVSSFDAAGLAIDVSSNSLGLSVSGGNPLNSLILARSSSVNSQTADYSFYFQQVQNSSNVFSVEFILDPVLSVSALSQVFQQLPDLTLTPLIFSRSGQTVLATLSAPSQTNYTVVLRTVSNPPSTQPLASPITITTYSSGSQFIFSQMQTHDIVNTAPSPTIVTSFSFSNLAFGETTTLTLDLTQPSHFPSLIHRLLLDIPSAFNLSALSCSGFAGIQCTIQGASSLQIKLANSSALPSPIVLAVGGLVTPSMGSPALVFSVSSFDSQNYIAQLDNSTVIFQNLCTLPCRTCSNQTICLSCYSAPLTNLTLLYGENCHDVCPSGSYQVNSSLCASCDPLCLSCQGSAINCSACNSSGANPFLYLNSSVAPTEGSCLSSCPLGTYLSNNSCLNCNASCSACNVTACSSCTALFYLFEGSCLSACPSNTLQDSANMTCIMCDSVCLTCQNQTVTCTSCPSFTFFSNSTCLSSCPSSNMFVDINQTCQTCGSQCETCSQISTNCTACNQSSSLPLFLNNSCLSSCPETYFANTSSLTCQPCQSLGINCSNCSSTTTCLSCDPGFYFFPPNSTCTASISAGYLPVNGTLTPCDASCATCQNDSLTCTSCSGNLSLFNNSCVPQCPANQTVSVSNVCTACSYPCSTCEISPSTCLSCQSNSSLFLDATSQLCVNSSQCPNGTYANTTTLTCEACNSSCSLCSSSANNCQACSGGFFLDLSSSTCDTSCPSGSTGINGTCQNCTSPCQTCFLSVSNCSSCMSSSPSLFLDASTQTCVNASQCPNLTYANDSSLVCQLCASPCLDCSSASTCLSCASNFSFFNSSCLSACPVGYVSIDPGSGFACQPCLSPCASCEVSQNNCSACLSNTSLFLQNNSCVNASQCDSSTFAESATNTCSPCISPCLTCNSASLCSSCINDTFLSNTSCVNASSCPAGTVAGVDSSTNLTSCIPCDSACLTCLLTTTHCSSCNSSQLLFLSNNLCVPASNCSNFSYPNSTTATCQPCPSPCLSCLDSVTCSSCQNAFVLTQNLTCETSCPLGTFNSTVSGINQCLSCFSGCEGCSGTNTSCSSCQNGTFLSSNQCINSSSCPNGTYPNSLNNSCSSCLSPCDQCSTASVCLTCASGQYLVANNGTCVNRSQCPEGTFGGSSTSNNLECLQCDPTCLSCSLTSTNCTSCSTLFLQGNSCVNSSQCSNGTFPDNSSQICAQCPSTCSLCSGLSLCQACTLGYHLHGSTCVSNCPNGTIPINGTCQNCLSPCLGCLNTTSSCDSCLQNLTNPLFVYSGTCYQASSCPSGSTAVVASLSCEVCQSGCLSCADLASNCSSCNSSLFLEGSSCVSSCQGGFFADLLTQTCQACNSSCLSCNTSGLCLSCSSPLLLFNSLCLASCPSTSPFNLSNSCSTCQEAVPNCQICDTALSTALCQGCSSTFVLFSQSCLASCPQGYINNGSGICVVEGSAPTDPLTESLKSVGIFPLPFTITGSIIFIACFMSKLQNRNTYIVGVAYSLYGIIEVACLSFTIIKFDEPADSNFKTFLIVSLLIIAGLNIFGLLVQSFQLARDDKFKKWLGVPFNCGFYGVVVTLSALTSYKFKMLIFTKLFSFQCLRAQLEHVQKFRVFNIMSFLGVAHEGLVLYVSVLTIIGLPTNSSQFLLFLDLVAINLINVILALAASSKAETFFEEEEEDGIKINKVYNVQEEYDVKEVEDTVPDPIKNNQQSRDNLLDQDDQFTLSISDRNEEDFPQMKSSQLAPPPKTKLNKSTLWDPAIESQTILRKDHLEPGNFSAVYEGDLTPSKRPRFQNQHNIVPIIHQKAEKNSEEQLSQKAPDNEPEVEKNIFEQEEEVQLPEQNIVMDMGQQAPTQFANNPLQERHNEEPVPHPDLEDEKHEDFEEPESAQALAIKERETKIYKGQQTGAGEGQDIDLINLALSKKQRELIELRKSIRKRQRSQERRREKSTSRDKNSKPFQSQKGVNPPSHLSQQRAIRQDIKVRAEHNKTPLIITSNNDPDLIEEELQAVPGSTTIHHKPAVDQVTAQQKVIPEQKMQTYPPTPLKQSHGVQDLIPQPSLQKSTAPNIPIPHKIQEENFSSHEEKQLGKNQSKDSSIGIDKNFKGHEEVAIGKGNLLKGQVEQVLEEYPHQKNIFQDRKQSSFQTEKPDLNPSEEHFKGLKAPVSKHNKKSINKDDNIFTRSKLDLNFQPHFDQQNLPLQNKSKNSSKGWEGQAVGEDALEDFIQKTQRTNVAPHRSHLLRAQKKDPNSTYQELEQVMTIRQPSFHDLSDKKSALDRPPLQNRPSTTSKSRMYMAGLQQMESHRADSRSKEKNDPHNRTTFDKPFAERKSKEFSREESIDIYPSSFSSNRIPIGSEGLIIDDEPRKPTVQSRTISRDHRRPSNNTQEEEHFLDNSALKKSMKSYRSRSIDREEVASKRKQTEKGEKLNDDLKEYYRKRQGSREGSREGSRKGSRQKSRSRSKSREKDRSSDKKQNELEKIYLQRLSFQ